MSSANTDKMKGALHRARGKVKEIAGKVTDNPKLRATGMAERVAGKARQKLGQIKTALRGR